MNFHLSQEQHLIQDMFAKLFRDLSTPPRIRAAESLGLDRDLWSEIVAMEAPNMRVPEAQGGGGAGLLDAVLVAEQAGRALISAPLVECIVANRLLRSLDSDLSQVPASLLSGQQVLTLALSNAAFVGEQVVPGGGVADAILWLDGDQVKLTLESGGSAMVASPNLGSLALALKTSPGSDCVLLASGKDASNAFLAAVEEWKLLSSALLIGIAQQAIEMAAEYSRERFAFGKPIGSFQGVAHPLANSITDVEGARLLLWRTVWSIEQHMPEAGANISLSFWFSSRIATTACTRAIRVFGGYGMTLEYDAQLYLRRARGIALQAGDPAIWLQEAGDRLWAAKPTALPAAGESGLEFGWGEEADRVASEARQFFKEHLNDELKHFAATSDDAHHPAFFQKLAKARLLYPEWPEQLHGRACDGASLAAVQEVFNEVDWPILVPVVTDMVGKMLLRFGTEQAKRDILPGLADGTKYCSLGYTEPSCGSDVFAAATKAVRDGDDWIINGQKMFTTQGHLADYALMLVRTDSSVAKHAGLTLFVVPLNQPGYESQEVKTIGAERTNITYYTDMRVPDDYRLGEVNEGIKIMSAALTLEQGVGLYNVGPLRRLLGNALQWARTAQRDGRLAIDQPQVRARLARVFCDIQVADALTRRSIWAGEKGVSQKWFGSMSKLFGSEAWLARSEDIMELAAPDSLWMGESAGGAIELEYRRSIPSTIYGGTSEVHRSIIAEGALEMPRSRS
jgi:alkylation response protein AidB-like acyl-CoA dehydrogenase